MRAPSPEDFDTTEDYEEAYDDYMTYCEYKHDELRDDLLTEGLEWESKNT